MTSLRSSGAVIAVSTLCAVSAGSLLWFGLSKLATPGAFADRLASLTQRTASLEAAERRGASPSTFAPGAVCNGLTPSDIQAVSRKLTTAAPAGVTVTNLQMGVPEAPSGRMAPVGLRLQAQGDYPLLTRWLDALARGQPEVFVDRLDLALQDSAVTANLTGKVYCWTSAAQ